MTTPTPSSIAEAREIVPDWPDGMEESQYFLEMLVPSIALALDRRDEKEEEKCWCGRTMVSVDTYDHGDKSGPVLECPVNVSNPVVAVSDLTHWIAEWETPPHIIDMSLADFIRTKLRERSCLRVSDPQHRSHRSEGGD